VGVGNNEMYATVMPSVIIQSTFSSGEEFAIPVELKIEVLWGRAYLGYMQLTHWKDLVLGGDASKTGDGMFHKDHSGMADALFFRNDRATFLTDASNGHCEVGLVLKKVCPAPQSCQVEYQGVSTSHSKGGNLYTLGKWMSARDCYPCGVPGAADQAAELGKRFGWILTEGHLETAWKRAEEVAQSLGADQVRVDVFLKKGQPSEVTMNEISLSSGLPYRKHSQYMAKLWVKGYQDRARANVKPIEASTSAEKFSQNPLRPQRPS